jgi:hypothetical protein
MRISIWQTVIALGCMALCSSLSAAHDIGWMYEADVPVQNQSQAARIQAAEAGLRQVLGRLTGQGEEGTSVRISGTSADRLMTRFSYHSQVVDGRRQPRVKLSFNPGQTLVTARNSGLPVWGASRPAVKLYLLVQEEDGAFAPLIETHPVRQAMTRRAWERGLVLTFPTFNDTTVPLNAMLEEINPNRPKNPLASSQVQTGAEPTKAVRAETVMAPGIQEAPLDPLTGKPLAIEPGAAEPVEPPPEPFLPDIIPLDTELVLVGELRTLPPAPGVIPGPAFRWAVGRDRGVIELPAGDAVAQGVSIVDRITDELGRRFAVPWVAPLAQTLRVDLVKSINAYAELMRYLGRQELFSRVDLIEAGSESFEFTVTTPANAESLVRIFRVDGRLLPQDAAEIAPDEGTLPPSDGLQPQPGDVVTDPTSASSVSTELPVFLWQD